MIQCVLNAQNRQMRRFKGVSPRHLDVMVLMTTKGPGVQGRETSMQVNRKVGLIVILVSPHPYYWLVLPLSVNMLLETLWSGTSTAFLPNFSPLSFGRLALTPDPFILFLTQQQENKVCALP